MKYEADMRDTFLEGYQIGYQEGIKEVRSRTINAIYAHLKRDGFSFEDVVLCIEKVYGIPKSEIQEILTNTKKRELLSFIHNQYIYKTFL